MIKKHVKKTWIHVHTKSQNLGNINQNLGNLMSFGYVIIHWRMCETCSAPI